MKLLIRSYSSSKKVFQRDVFDRSLKKRQKQWSLTLEDAEYYDYLRDEAAHRLVDRLEDISRKFPLALDLGSHRGHVLKSLIKSSTDIEEFGVIGGIEKLLQCDTTEAAVSASHELSLLNDTKALGIDIESTIADEEELHLSGFDDESFNLVTSSMNLHWVNDIPQALRNIQKILKPDGVFIGCMIGGTTLQELRHCLYLAEQERAGGFSPHVSPLTLPSDVAGLLQGAGFNLPTVDIETIQIGYPNMFVLMEHLQKMGEANASLARTFPVDRDTFLSAAALYEHLYPVDVDDKESGIVATFQLIYMIGWKPDRSQPLPKKRGSATRSLKELSVEGKEDK